MKHKIQLTVNEARREIEVAPWQTLMDVLRETFRLTRTKEGCGVGECGACAVLMDGKIVSACLVLAVNAGGKQITTMEGVDSKPGFTAVMESFIHPDPGAMRASPDPPGAHASTETLTFCHICPGHCSVRAVVEDGRLVDLAPDVESGLFSEQCAVKKGRFTIPEVMRHQDRLLYPQKRSGARGQGQWQRISWDEALDTVASKFKQLKAKYGPQSLSFGLGEPKGLEFAFAQRLASALGTPNVVTPGWCCGIPKGMASAFTYGSGCVCDDGNIPAMIVLWGSNMVHTTGGMRRETLTAAIEKGGRLIVIDPQKTDVAKLADLWIRVRPGGDGALAMGFLKVMLEKKLYDEHIVANWTIGFEQLQQQVAAFSLKDVEKATWVPAAQMEQFVELYARVKPAAMQTGNAVDQLISSFQTGRAIAILRALSGNLNIPGGDVFLTSPPFTRPGSFFLLKKYPRAPERTLGKQFKFAQGSAFIPPHAWTRGVLEGKPHPIKAAMFILTNPLVSYPDSQQVYRALMRLEFMVTSELFITPTAALADILLPAAWGMEHDELGYWPGWYEEIRSHPKVVDPPGQCWPDTKIINELAKRLDMQEDFWKDDHEALDAMLAPSGMKFEEFKNARALKPERQYQAHAYRTPSGKIEIYSDRLAQMGYAPLPLWEEVSKIHEISRQYPLLLSNAKEEAYMLSGFRSIASLRMMRPEPLVEINPETARSLGLQEGDWVYIETARGKIRQRLLLNDDLDRRVVMGSFGWWFPEQREMEYGWRHSNINILIQAGPEYDPSTGGITLRGIPCKLYPVEPD
ncbi:MAG: molybdopterin-dependent oxidoreductase [Desulfobacterales bacterium]|nr:molybdopterin-dependent oxidoreductase [Desulfobacterales bacterium]